MSLLRTENLTYIYGENTPYQVEAVQNISISIEKGDFIGIIGCTGSGKSTLVQCLNGLLKPNSGRVLINEEDVRAEKKKLRELRFRVGLVFQYPEYQLFDNTVYDDIAFGPKNKGLQGEELKNCVMDAVELVGLDTKLLDKSPFEISGGEKRRVAIAGVISMKPEVLILDEPTAGLDPEGRKKVFDMLEKYRSTTGSAVIIVSHSMDDIANYADKTLVMKKGEVLAFDKTHKIFSNTELIHSAGLDVPHITAIFEELKKRGCEVPQDIITVKEAVEFFVNRVSGGNYAK